ncbi:MAG TPA: 50S ribosomal protein L33 [Mycoplasmatales bacterium]|nr:50S ribosomal protein L33 [Mycoplasmatales bacterium]
MSNSKRINIFLVCSCCKERNYSISKKPSKEKLSTKKFCKRCDKRVSHKELIKK